MSSARATTVVDDERVRVTTLTLEVTAADGAKHELVQQAGSPYLGQADRAAASEPSSDDHRFTTRPDPSDRRARLLRATPRGKQLYAIARDVVAEIEAEWTKRLGKTKMRQLRGLLEELNAGL